MEELDSHPDFQLLLLDKNTAIQQLAQRSNENNRNCNNSSLENAKKKIKKKEKMKIRKELLEKKIHVIKLLKQEEKGKLVMTSFEHITHKKHIVCIHDKRKTDMLLLIYSYEET